jgi:hypothetical protein
MCLILFFVQYKKTTISNTGPENTATALNLMEGMLLQGLVKPSKAEGSMMVEA